MHQSWLNIILFLILLSCYSCSTNTGDKKKLNLKEPLIKMNKTHVEIEDEQIESYVQRHQWKMRETGSGLRYWIYEKGEGQLAEKGMVALITYNVELLSGKTAYTKEDIGKQQVLIGRDEIETGMHELLPLLHVGDKVKVVLPSHLAFGLLGDQKKVPMKSSLVYDLELLDLK